VKHSPPAAILLGQRVREHRTKRSLTQQELAEAAGIPQQQVSAIERGAMLPSLVTVIRIAIALDCKVAKLVAVFDEADLTSLIPK
jgi:transcriptional regulator with XRE-family HTH domain